MTIVRVTEAQYAELLKPEYDESPKLRAMIEGIRQRTAARIEDDE